MCFEKAKRGTLLTDEDYDRYFPLVKPKDPFDTILYWQEQQNANEVTTDRRFLYKTMMKECGGGGKTLFRTGCCSGCGNRMASEERQVVL